MFDLIHRVRETRIILEELPPKDIDSSPILRSAYGKSWYKCPVIQCERFLRGFDRRGMRDQHLKIHDREYKCSFRDCEYAAIGFPAKAELTRHEELCHCELDHQFSFPNVSRASLDQILKNAIDKDDASAVREICAELAMFPTAETGFLYQAVKRKSFNAALTLLESLESESLLQYQTHNGRTVMHEVVRNEHTKLLQLIVRTGVDVNAEDKFGRTPLSEALEHGSFHAASILLSHTEIKIRTNREKALDSYKKGFLGAISGGHNAIVRAIYKNFVDIGDDRKRQLLYLVTQALTATALDANGFQLILDLGRETGFEKRYPDRLKKALLEGMKKAMGRNDLLEAARKGEESNVLSILQKGANINRVSNLGYTALSAASLVGQVSIVQLLLDKGADYNRGGNLGTALYMAASQGHLQIVESLLRRGVNVNASGGKFGRALVVASHRGHERIAKLLLNEGAEIDVGGTTDNNPLYVASRQEHHKVVKLLLESGASKEMALVAASADNWPRVVRALLDHGADAKFREEKEDLRAPMQAAALAGHNEVIKILLENGASVNAQGGYYGNALQAAASRGHNETVRLLLENGANVNAQGGEHVNALQAALIVYCEADNKDTVIKALLEHGADTSAISENHKNRLEAAVSRLRSKDWRLKGLQS